MVGRRELRGDHRVWGSQSAHTTGALAIFAIRAVAVRVLRRLVQGVKLILGRPGEGGLSGRSSPLANQDTVTEAEHACIHAAGG